VTAPAPAYLGASILIELPWPARELSPNYRSRSHWPLYRAKKAAKEQAFWATRYEAPLAWKHDGSRIAFVITAYPPDKRDRDDDNLIASMKAARDGIAAALKVDDHLFDQRLQWGEPVKGGKVVVSIG
jgi:crossover junction endodeoxyribonuclease RusA